MTPSSRRRGNKGKEGRVAIIDWLKGEINIFAETNRPASRKRKASEKKFQLGAHFKNWKLILRNLYNCFIADRLKMLLF